MKLFIIDIVTYLNCVLMGLLSCSIFYVIPFKFECELSITKWKYIFGYDGTGYLSRSHVFLPLFFLLLSSTF